MIIPVLEAAQDRLDPARADLGARDIHRRAVVQRRVRAPEPRIGEDRIAEHLARVVRDARKRGSLFAVMPSDHTPI